jgi:nucleotide-binding universal stress UspA family protein
MTLKSIMAHLEMGRSHSGVLAVAGDLAERFDCEVIGIAACQPMRIGYAGMAYAGMAYVGDCFQLDRDELDAELRNAETEFRKALTSRAPSLQWRSDVTVEPLSDYFAREARGADLIITHTSSAEPTDNSRRINTGSLVIQAGRPVLIAPAHAKALKLDRMLVAWKDNREARRAIRDALPLLMAATEVVVATLVDADHVARAEADLDDVLAWLKRHGVAATALAVAATGDDYEQLRAIAKAHKPDVIVAGAYGHSRLHEWVLGGVTKDLLHDTHVCALLSH